MRYCWREKCESDNSLDVNFTREYANWRPFRSARNIKDKIKSTVSFNPIAQTPPVNLL